MAAPGPEASAPIPPGIALGVYQHGAPWHMGALAELEAHAERRVAIVMWYQDWVTTREVDLDLFARVRDHGAVPLLTWEPWDHMGGARQRAFSLNSIANGAHDGYVRDVAARLAAHGGPVLLRWAHEMNGHWYPWGVGAGATPAAYVAAWRRLWRLFQEAGAQNVRWVWSPNILDGCADFTPCYPGPRYVDWLALDGYNWGGWRRWRSFHRLFAASYSRLAALGPQPIMIAETASAEAGGDKARWIMEALTRDIPTEMPRVRAVIWFNQHKERDWRIESSPRSQQAFARAVSGPLYAGKLSPTTLH